MTKRLITALLGASLAVVLGATAAGATTPTDFGKARDKAFKRYSPAASVKALTGAPAQGGEEGGTPPCVGIEDPSLEPLFEEFANAIIKIVDSDEVLAEIDAKITAAEEQYFDALDAAETADEINAAFDAFAEAIENWRTDSKARVAELKPKFGEAVATFIEALEKAGVCEEDVDAVKKELAEGQAIVDGFQQAIDEVADEGLELAKQDRDDALKRLEEQPPPSRPDETIPPSSGPTGPELPGTGANSLPVLLGGLALISGGSTFLIVARRRNAAA